MRKLIKAIWQDQQAPERGSYGILVVEENGKRFLIIGRGAYTNIQSEKEEIASIMKTGAIVDNELLSEALRLAKASK